MAALRSAVTRTVNASEIAHFSRLSQHWWNENGEFSLLHQMNPPRLSFINQKLAESNSKLSGLDVLDVGCGGGLLSESLARLGARTHAIDASESNINIAQLHAESDPKLASDPSRLTYQHTSAEDLLASTRKRYDVVCSMEVLEHVDNPSSFLSSIGELVKPGGHLFLSTVARTPLSYFLTIFAAEQVLRKVSPGTHTYSKFINPSELVSFFQTHPPSRPWISKNPHSASSQYETRGIIYLPWESKWKLLSRTATQYGGAECNYMFWVRKPLEAA